MELDVLLVFLSCCTLIFCGQNSNITTPTLESTLLLFNDAELNNSTISIINLENSGDGSYLTYAKSFLTKLDNWLSRFFNRSSLILTIAFFLGFIAILLIILISICFYKSTCAKKSSNSRTKITTNPAYDQIPKVDFLGSEESLNKNRIDRKINSESPDSKISNETIRLIDFVDKDVVESANLVKTVSNQSIKSFSSSSTSKNSVIAQTPDRLIEKNPTLASLNGSNIKSSISNLSRKLNSSSNLEKSGLLADQESPNSKNRFTPNSKKSLNRYSKNIEEQISRRSLFFNRTKSESGAEQGEFSALPPVPTPDQSNKRASIVSSIGSIANGQITIDFSQIKEGVEDFLKDGMRYKQSSSSINFIKESCDASMSDIYMQCIKEKREKIKKDKCRTNKQKEVSSTSINMNPNGALQRNSVANLDSESIKTFGTEKSCY